jgi:non-canonical (house-cleaning) NTP pyrophosphatase
LPFKCNLQRYNVAADAKTRDGALERARAKFAKQKAKTAATIEAGAPVRVDSP